MSAAYPRAGDARHMPKWAALRSKKGVYCGPICCVCGQPATHRVFVEMSWFRGDDEGPFKSCKSHKGEAAALLDSRSEVASQP